MYARLAVPWSVDGLRRGSWVALQLRLGPSWCWAEQRTTKGTLLCLLACLLHSRPAAAAAALIEHKTQDTHSTAQSSLRPVLSCLLSPTTARLLLLIAPHLRPTHRPALSNTRPNTFNPP